MLSAVLSFLVEIDAVKARKFPRREQAGPTPVEKSCYRNLARPKTQLPGTPFIRHWPRQSLALRLVRLCLCRYRECQLGAE
jgi:hypothetical protein